MRLHVILVAMLLVGCEKYPLQGLVSPTAQEESRAGDHAGSSGDTSDKDNPSQDQTSEKLPSDDYLGLRKGLILEYQTSSISDLGPDLGGRMEEQELIRHEVTTVEVQGEQASASIWVTGFNLASGPISPSTTLYLKKQDGLYRKPPLGDSADLFLPFPLKDSVRVIREASSSTHIQTVNGYQDTVTVVAGAETATVAMGKTIETPAGTFENCVEVRVTQLTNEFHAAYSTGFTGKVESGMTITRWFAPGLGLIKFEQIHFNRDPRVEPMSLEYHGSLATYSVPVAPASP